MDIPKEILDIPHAAMIVFLVVGTTQTAKQIGLSGKYLPLVAPVVGGALAAALIAPVSVFNVLAGVALGMSTSGAVNLIKKLNE